MRTHFFYQEYKANRPGRIPPYCNACQKERNNACVDDPTKKKNDQYQDLNGTCRQRCDGSCKKWDRNNNVCKDLFNTQECKSIKKLNALPNNLND